MKISSVTIEGMHNVIKKTYNFSDVNYLHGKNGVGKSTILQAVQLALLGYIPGQAKTKESILANTNNHTMAITLELTSDSFPVTIRRIWTKTGKGSTSVVDITPESFKIEDVLAQLELPIFNFNEFRGMTANKLKDWFIDFLPSGDAEFDWGNILLTEVKGNEAYDEIIAEANCQFESVKGLKPVDQIRFANSYFKDKISTSKSAINHLDSTVKSLIFYDDIEDNSMTVEELQAESDRYQKLREDIVKANGQAAARDNILRELSALEEACDGEDAQALDKDIKAISDAISKCEAEFDHTISARNNLKDKASELNTRQAEIRARFSEKESIINSGGVCSYTKTQCPSIAALISELNAEVDKQKDECNSIQSEIDEIYQKVSDTDKLISELNMELRSKVEACNTMKAKKQAMVQNIDRMNYLKKLASDIDTSIQITDTSEIDNKLKYLQDTIVKTLANKKFESMTETLAKERMQFELNLEAYKAWEKLTSVNGLQNRVSTEPFVKFSTAMDKYIAPLFGGTTSAAFNLVEKANSFSFGIDRGGQYIPYDLLSSGEKCMFTLAMMITLVANSSDELKVIMIDDMFDNLDDENAAVLIDKLSDITDVQFIIAGVKDIKIANNTNLMEVTAE